MAREWIYKIGGTGTGLTQDEIDNNMLCIYGSLSGLYGFTLKAACAVIGNFYRESNCNPGIYETSHGGTLDNLPYFPGGMGLMQWTDYPAYQSEYPNPLPWTAQKEGKNWYDGNFQCWLVNQCDNSELTDMGYGQGPRWGWQTSSTWPSMAFDAFKKSGNLSLDYLTEVFYYCGEWHYSVEDGTLKYRKEWAAYAYELLKGTHPIPPGGSDTPNYVYAIMALIKKKRREGKDNGRGFLRV